MKKIVLIVSTVLVLIVATYFADKATRVKAVSSLKNTTQPNDAPGGKLAPEVTFKDLNGKDAALAQYKGKVILVNFWATGAIPATSKFPGLSKCNRSTKRRVSPFSASPWMKKAK